MDRDLKKYRYSPYGEVEFYDPSNNQLSKSAIDMTTLFTGRELDPETGLYYFRARMYDAEMGRYISRDPIGYVDGYNLYAGWFVVGMVDPFGEKCEDCSNWDIGWSRGSLQQAFDELEGDTIGDPQGGVIYFGDPSDWVTTQDVGGLFMGWKIDFSVNYECKCPHSIEKDYNETLSNWTVKYISDSNTTSTTVNMAEDDRRNSRLTWPEIFVARSKSTDAQVEFSGNANIIITVYCDGEEQYSEEFNWDFKMVRGSPSGNYAYFGGAKGE